VGAQQAGVFNIVGDEMTGYQGAGVFNITGGRASFLQAAGVFNIAGATFSGLQAAGVFNISTQQLQGVQAAGVFNIAEDPVYGGQIAGVFNSAEQVGGAQIGLVNMASTVYGTQIGLVNIASGEVRGTQIGLVNIAKNYRGFPVGLINIIDDGYFHISNWYSELGIGYLGLEMGTRNLYGLFYAGMELSAAPDLYLVGVGAGLHIPIGPVFVDVDLSAKQVFQGRTAEELAASTVSADGLPSLFPSGRATVGLGLGSFSVFGGIIVDTVLTGLTAPTPLHREQGDSGSMELWGLQVGLYPKLFGGVGIRL
jgi:hypothetical protein